jgi:anti-sigma regulatory factor (Ser/Thr protein kinase)
MEQSVSVGLSRRAPGTIRDALQQYYGESLEPSLFGDVSLLTSELVTNSVIHSGRPEGDPLTVATTVVDGVLRVEVTDRGEGAHNLEARTGHPPSGLGYVDLLSDRWSSRSDEVFRVWFEIDVVARQTFHRAQPLDT